MSLIGIWAARIKLRMNQFILHCLRKKNSQNKALLVGGFNPSVNGNLPPNRVENKKYLKPPPRLHFQLFVYVCYEQVQFPASWCHQFPYPAIVPSKKKLPSSRQPMDLSQRCHYGTDRRHICHISVQWRGFLRNAHRFQEKYVEMLCFSGRALEKAAFYNINFTFSSAFR